MFYLSKQLDYGLLLLSYLTDKDDFVSLTKVVKDLKLPKRFLARIASKLAEKKILLSHEGKKGGYKINSKVKSISLYDYLKIFEDDFVLTRCFDDDYDCPFEKNCQHKNFFNHRLRKVFIKNLKKEKLFKTINFKN